MNQVVDPEADQARPESIAMIAIAALGVGLVLTLGLARVMPSVAASDVATNRAAAAQLSRAQLQAARAQLPVASAIPARNVSATRGLPAHASAATQKPVARSLEASPKPTQPAAAATSVAPKPAPPAAATAATPLAAAPAKLAAVNPPLAAAPSANAAKRRTPKYEFEQGVFAYVRCDGEERRGARFPCPRDRKFEEQVWQVLEGLTTCDADPGRGSAEVRLTLRKDKIHGVEWKPSTPGPSLNLRAVAKCAGAKLADARTRLKAPEGLVSFRFSLK